MGCVKYTMDILRKMDKISVKMLFFPVKAAREIKKCPLPPEVGSAQIAINLLME